MAAPTPPAPCHVSACAAAQASMIAATDTMIFTVFAMISILSCRRQLFLASFNVCAEAVDVLRIAVLHRSGVGVVLRFLFLFYFYYL
jgi:hypothetical protein